MPGFDADLVTLIDLLGKAEEVVTKIHREVWAENIIPLASVEMWVRIKRNIHDASATAAVWKNERQNKD